MRVALGTDHAGFATKEAVKAQLIELGHDVLDFGTNSNEACDYPDFVRPAAMAVKNGEADRGIVFGGSGNGEAIVCNRIPGIRCAVVWSEFTAHQARAHNDAQMMSIGERTVTPEDVARFVVIFLDTSFEGGRHQRRIDKIDA